MNLTDDEFVEIMEYLDKTNLETNCPTLWKKLDAEWEAITLRQLYPNKNVVYPNE